MKITRKWAGTTTDCNCGKKADVMESITYKENKYLYVGTRHRLTKKIDYYVDLTPRVDDSMDVTNWRYEILTVRKYRWLVRQLSKSAKTDYHVGSYFIASVRQLSEKQLLEKVKWAGTSVGYCIRVL